ncbi:MAG: TonB-dependent receptor [Candidatus Solibacter sp.]
MALLLVWCAARAVASPTGAIGGTITDVSRAPVAGARILAANLQTKFSAVAVSDAAGSYRFLQLAPGAWSLTVEAPRFKRAHVSEAVVQVDRAVRADFVLEVGELAESVVVEAHPAAESGDPTLGSFTGVRAIAAVPLNGRQFLDLSLLAPGVLAAGPGTQGGGFNASGMRSQSNVYLLDGVSNQDTQTNGPLNLFRISDAVQEFAVQTSAAPAEFGRGAGAQVNIVTRGGTNTLHGAAFEYLRNTVFNAADFFTNKQSGEPAALHRNQFGATLGGPVVRDRSFFFASYEGFRQAASAVTVTLVPTEAQRATVTDAISQRLLAYWPLPNTTGAANYISAPRSIDSDNTGLLRLDHRLSERDQLSARWTQYWGATVAPGATPLSGGNRGPLAQISLALNEVHAFSPTFLNEFRLGVSGNSTSRVPQDQALNAAAIFTDSSGAPLPGAVDSRRDPLNGGLPSLSIGGGFAALGANANFPQGRTSRTYEIFDNLSRHAPIGATRHTLRWGAHARRESLSRYLNRAERGTINFQSFADFARGQINTATFRTGNTQSAWTRYPWDAYVQDEFRSGGFTLQLGLRYEAASAIAEREGRATNFVPGVGPVVVGGGPLVGIDSALRGPAALTYRPAPLALPASGVFADRNNVAPMVGFAWSPASRGPVLRGGFRMAYDELFNNVPAAMALNVPRNIQTTQTANVTQPAKFPWSLAFDQNVPLISNVGKQGPGTPTAGVLTFQGVDPHLRNTFAYIYHLGVQTALGRAVSLEADYQGSSGRALGMYIDVNQPAVIVRDASRRGPLAPNEQVFPYNQFNQAQVAQSIGSSNYNAAVLTANVNASGQFLRASYTAGKSLDYNSSYFGSGNLPGEPGAPVDATNLRLEHGPSAFDTRQRFVLLYLLEVPRPRMLPATLAGGWTVSGVITMQSGLPFTVVNGGPDSSGFNQMTSGVSPNGGNRPDVIKAGALPVNFSNPDAAFDTSWFAAAFAGRAGTSGRNQYYGPGMRNVDVAIAKWLALTERVRLQARADFFNALNHTNFANPVADLNNASFGRITQTLGSAVSTSVGTTGGATGGPRLIQLSLRVQF